MVENESQESATPKEAPATEDTAVPASSEVATKTVADNDDDVKKVDNKAREITTREAYFASLNEWVKHANISQNAMALFPWYLISSYPQMFQTQAGWPMFPSGTQQLPNLGGAAAHVANVVNGAASPLLNFGNGFRILDDQAQLDVITRMGGYEYIIAPFWKRAAAEIIDVFILLLFKIVTTFTIMNVFDFDMGIDMDKEVLRKAIDDDDYGNFLAASLDFLAFSSDLLLLEVLTKILVCFYEAAWTTLHNGATPGKAIMGLRILYVEAVLPLQPVPQMQPPLGFQAQRMQMRALLYPAEVPKFQRAFMRAVAKNLIITLLFPMCFVMIFFKNNRTAYDIITKTVVVENNANPVLRRTR